jgi:hypothetical protein
MLLGLNVLQKKVENTRGFLLSKQFSLPSYNTLVLMRWFFLVWAYTRSTGLYHKPLDPASPSCTWTAPTMIQRDSLEKPEKTPPSPVEDEKHVAISETDGSVDDGDEALHLVGRERTEQFSEEYNRRLRRKLVRPNTSWGCKQAHCYFFQDFVIPPLCAAVYFTQFLYVIQLSVDYLVC